MNLELLDPFGRQIPDRIDSTLSLPPALHFRNYDASKPSSSKNKSNAASSNQGGGAATASTSKRSASNKRGAAAAAAAVVEDLEWKAAYHVSFNRRGTYLAVGYGSSTVAVFNTLSRTLAALYQSDVPDLRPGNIQDGVTSLTWSRRSRTLLCGAAGDAVVRLHDTSHRFGPEQACKFVVERQSNTSSGGSNADGPPSSGSNAGGGGGGAADAGGDPDDIVASPPATKAPKSAGGKSSRSKAASASNEGAADPATHTGASNVPSSSSSLSPAFVPQLSLDKTHNTSFADPDIRYVYGSDRRAIPAAVWEMGSEPPPAPAPTPEKPTRLSDDDEGKGSQSMEVDDEPKVGKGRSRRRAASRKTKQAPSLSSPEPDHDAAASSPASAGATADTSVQDRDDADGDIDNNNAAAEEEKSAPQSSVPQKHPCVSIEFDHPVGGALQVNPRLSTAGLAALMDGTLVLFYVPPASFVSNDSARSMNDDEPAPKDPASSPAPPIEPPSPPVAWIVPLMGRGANAQSAGRSSSSASATHKTSAAPWITCASFDHGGEHVFAATKDGTLFAFDVRPLWTVLQQHANSMQGSESGADASSTIRLPVVEPHVTLSIGGSTAWHLLVSRSGRDLVVNSSDGALRLFKVSDLLRSSFSSPPSDVKPLLFQDVVTKVKFACCDLSGDGEHLVGGANGDDTKYRLYLWSTATGQLLDRLTGPPLQLYAVAWHPSRTFVAVATSDGLVDVWGPRVNWTAFAPDFQALPHNVEYVEREDEFDVDETGRYLVDTLPSSNSNKTIDAENDVDDAEGAVDVTTVEKVPVFASDSESEADVFHYDVRLVNLLAERKGKYRDKSLDLAD
jgi:hypothetical protein